MICILNNDNTVFSLSRYLTLASDEQIEKPHDVVYMSDTVIQNNLIMQPEVHILMAISEIESKSSYSHDFRRIYPASDI